MITSILTLTLLIISISVFIIYYFFSRTFNRKYELLQSKKSELEGSLNELKSASFAQTEEKEKFEIEKKKTLEKNKKIWQMSETVYIEKKKVDDQVELLQFEKMTTQKLF